MCSTSHCSLVEVGSCDAGLRMSGGDCHTDYCAIRPATMLVITVGADVTPLSGIIHRAFAKQSRCA